MSDDVRWTRRLFRILLLAYPRRIRKERGADMWLTFEHHLRDARRAGWFAVFDLWGREVIALWRGARRARISARERRHAHRRPVGSERTKSVMAFGMSWLDFKLGFRMLVKYPGLTLVGGLGMSVAIAIGASAFGAIDALIGPLPVDEGERVIKIQNWDVEINNQSRQSVHDFITWREELESVEDLSAFTRTRRNLVTPDGRAEPVRTTAITASGFRVWRVLPLMGRTFLDEDQEGAAVSVVVIGYDVWRNRFASDPDVVGQSVRLGNTVHTVVGVMPEGFGFPINDQLWTPLRLDQSDYERGQGPDLFTFGRLADGITVDEGQAELTTIGRRAAAAFPDTHQHIRPQIMPYTSPSVPGIGWKLYLTKLLISMLLVVVAVNVAVLVYARTAMRRMEIAVRTALGASRGRVVAQFFVEALVLAVGAAVVGLVMAEVALGQANARLFVALGDQLPFWFDLGLSPGSVVYVVGLTVLAGVIVGVVPAIKATGHRVQASLQRLGGGGARMQLGGTWTVLIVVQVAIAVGVLPAAVSSAWQATRFGVADPGFAAEEYVTANLGMDWESSEGQEVEADRRAYASRFAGLSAELVRRLDAEPGVSDVTFSAGEAWTVWIEVDGIPTPAETRGITVRRGSAGHHVRFNRVAIDYFDAFDLSILTGRGFAEGDADSATTAVIVNRTFVRHVLGGRDPLGRRLSYVGLSGDVPQDVDLGRWYEIVGVVSDFPNPVDTAQGQAKLYHAVAPGQVYPMSLALRLRGAEPAPFTARLRAVGAAVDPTLQLYGVRRMDEELRSEQRAVRMMALGIGIVTLSVILLSAAGIYALMSFTVTQRQREIGIRTALGAHQHGILVSVFTRAVGQLVIGVVVGIVAAALLDRLSAGGVMGGEGAIILPVVSALMIAVGLLAAVGPARRGLRIQPIEALRADG